MYLWLTSCLTGLESTKQVNLTKAKQLNQSKQVKQQVKPQRDTSPYKVREYSKCRKKLTYQSSSQCTDNPTKNKMCSRRPLRSLSWPLPGRSIPRQTPSGVTTRRSWPRKPSTSPSCKMSNIFMSFFRCFQ